ncbi:MAG: hypothetical protein AAF317_13960 [Pseudomonadota bacterium]
MNGKFLADQSLQALFDPAQPWLYLFVVAPGILIALGRPRLAFFWIAAMIAGVIFLSFSPGSSGS